VVAGEDEMSGTKSQRDLKFDTVRITAWTYAVYCVTMVPAYATTMSPLAVGDWLGLGLTCVLFAAAALSAARRKRIGYYFCWVFSLLILPGVPIGTILGWNMLRALRQNRDRFF
jgi:hypothetical protein